MFWPIRKILCLYIYSNTTNNIYDFAGNVREWTEETNDSLRAATRGGGFNNDAVRYPVACRIYRNPNDESPNVGFRATLYIK